MMKGRARTENRRRGLARGAPGAGGANRTSGESRTTVIALRFRSSERYETSTRTFRTRKASGSATERMFSMTKAGGKYESVKRS